VVGKASCNGSISADTGDVVDFKQVNGNMVRDAGRGSPFYRTDASLKKTFRIPRTESVRLELQVDALNLFNHSNWQGFNANNVLLAIGQLGVGSPTCTRCLRPDGTYAGNNGQILHLSDITKGRISPNLLLPTFGGVAPPPVGLFDVGDPTTVDGSRLFQLSFHVRF
jgi:hypothetical protein